MASSSASEEEGTRLSENILKFSRDSVQFGFLRLGKYCNASDSYLFTNATCNICCIKDERDVLRLLEALTRYSDGEYKY